jgi:membrane-associated phospholipid phosphatase
LKKTLPFFSYLFHPIFIATFGVLIYFLLSTGYFNYQTIYLYVIQTLIITVFIPLAIFYFLITINKIDSIMIANVSQRKTPLTIQIGLFVTLFLKSFTLEFSPPLFYFFLGSSISSLLALGLVFYNRKISLHMLGMSSLTFFGIAVMIYFGNKNIVIPTLLIFCNGLVAASRLEMKAHTPTELILGYLVGILPQVLLSFYWI